MRLIAVAEASFYAIFYSLNAGYRTLPTILAILTTEAFFILSLSSLRAVAKARVNRKTDCKNKNP